MLQPLNPEKLYHRCEPEGLGFATTRDVEPLTTPLGQDRALESLEFGVGMPHEGYNIYVMGSTGLGKHSLVREALKARSRAQARPCDWCYVNNFEDHHAPIALSLPAGRAHQLRRDMEQLLEDLLNAIPAAFQTDEFQRRAQEIRDEFKQREEEVSAALGKKAEERGIALLHTPNGFTLAPVRDDKVLGPAELKKLPEEEQERIGKAIEELKEELRTTMEKIPIWQREMRKRFKQLNRELMELTVSQLIAELETAYGDVPGVLDHLGRVREDVIEHGDQFRSESGDGAAPSPQDTAFNRYRVNVLVDNAETEGAPVVIADNPTYQNLVGRVEHIARMGTLTTDFTLIKAGALHHANGGYLVLDADQVLTHAFAWDALKRVLISREIRIESLERLLSLATTISLEPEPIPVDVKVVLIGDRLLYYLLRHYEPRFSPLFKVAADFSESFPRAPENDRLFARMIAGLVEDGRLRPLYADAVARVVEHAARRSDDGEKLSLQTSQLNDLIREADYCAGKAGRDLVARDDVQQAIDAADRRVSQVKEHLQEEILRDTLMVDTRGVQLAQVNGLSVVQLGGYAFGSPTRISATARLGSGEIIDIE
ncbi:MAG: ATP-binding protein, partial [Chromatiales bacterium]